MSDSLACAYCREPLPDRIVPNCGLCRCPTCGRPLLVKERFLGIRLAKGGVASVLFLIVLLCPVVGLAGVPLLFCAEDLYLALVMLCVAAMGAALAHEGWLSLTTGVDVTPWRQKVYGLEALLGGTAKLLVGTAAACGGLYSLARDLLR